MTVSTVGQAVALWVLLAVATVGCRRNKGDDNNGVRRPTKATPPDGGSRKAGRRIDPASDAGGGVADPVTSDAGSAIGTAPRQRQSLRKDLRVYARKWATLGKIRSRLRTLLRQASAARSKENAKAVGRLIANKVVPEFERLVRTLSSFKPRSAALRTAHLKVLAGYREMLGAYRLAGRAWQASGQGVALALRKLRKARVRLRSARKALADLASMHNVTIK